ncbi:MAG: DUF92 domain-containing protein [Candidatus Diapherotrites archaeon]
MDSALEVAALAAMLFFFSAIAYKNKSLDYEGIAVGNIIGIAMYLAGGMTAFITTVIFYGAGESSTTFARKNIGKNNSEHEKRTTGNIIGNSGAALIALILGSWVGFFGAFAAALADTLSSEIGLLSKQKPKLITTMQEVEPGADGGVTWVGFMAALVGALIISGFYFFLFQDLKISIILIIAGFTGSVVDSILGATLERKKMINNTIVNFIGSSSGALVAFGLSIMF